MINQNVKRISLPHLNPPPPSGRGRIKGMSPIIPPPSQREEEDIRKSYLLFPPPPLEGEV